MMKLEATITRTVKHVFGGILAVALACACATGSSSGGDPNVVPSVDGGSASQLPDAGVARDGAGEAATTAPGLPAAGEVIFVELFVNPGSPLTDDAGEFVELLNVSDHAIDLAGCVLDDAGVNGDAYTISGPVVVAPKSLVVFAKKQAAGENGGIDDVAEAFGTAFSLGNGGGTVNLVCGETTIDRVEFDTTWPYAEGVAMQFAAPSPTASENDAKSRWCKAGTVYGDGQRGSPGTMADHCQ